MYLFLFPEGIQHSLASCSSPELHLGILMMNRDRSCATRSSAKATGTFIKRMTQHSHRDHLGPEQAIFLPGSFPCFSTYRSIPRATYRDRELAFHVIHLVSSWNPGLDRLGLAWLGNLPAGPSGPTEAIKKSEDKHRKAYCSRSSYRQALSSQQKVYSSIGRMQYEIWKWSEFKALEAELERRFLGLVISLGKSSWKNRSAQRRHLHLQTPAKQRKIEKLQRCSNRPCLICDSALPS